MGKIYDLYPKEQRKIDNQARRIRGYEKMKKDLQSSNRKLNRENRDLRKRIDEATECIKEFLCTEEYIKFDGEAIANNYQELLEILKGVDK